MGSDDQGAGDEARLIAALEDASPSVRLAALDEIAKRDDVSERLLDAVVLRLGDRGNDDPWAGNTYDDPSFSEGRYVSTVANRLLSDRGAATFPALRRGLDGPESESVLSALTVRLMGRISEIPDAELSACEHALRRHEAKGAGEQSLRLLRFEGRRRAGTFGAPEHLEEIERLLLADSPKMISSKHYPVWRALRELPREDGVRIAQRVLAEGKSELAESYLRELAESEGESP